MFGFIPGAVVGAAGIVTGVTGVVVVGTVAGVAGAAGIVTGIAGVVAAGAVAGVAGVVAGVAGAAASVVVGATAIYTAYLIRDLFCSLFGGPTKENDTMREVRLRVEHEQDMKANALESGLQQKVEKLAGERWRASGEAQTFGGPLRWPSSAEFNSAIKRTKYNSSNFNFAVVGIAGSGKSSLINAFINRGSKSPGAAPTGTTETTLEIGRYPDPGTEPPRNKIVWFDVPGAGTHQIPHEDYFIRQGLFVFDLIVLAIGDRFTQIDGRIATDCMSFKIPLFIVRSKADMHIRNLAQESDDSYARISDSPELYIKSRNEFVADSQRSVSEGLKREGLKDYPVYIVSRGMLQRTYSSALQEEGQEEDQEEGWPKSLKYDPAMIHEMHLVTNLLGEAVKRRCDIKERPSIVDKQKAVEDGQVNDMALVAVLPKRDGDGPLPPA